MGFVVIAVWAILAWLLIEENAELVETIGVWRAAVITVILILCAPVFFLSDLCELILDFVAGDEEEE